MKNIVLFIGLFSTQYVFSETLDLTAGQQLEIQVNGCEVDQAGVLKLENNKLTASCTPKICTAHSFGWAGKNEKINEVILLPEKKVILREFKGRKNIRELMQDFVANKTCAKAIIYWMNSTETISLN